jgi:CubicO group peptidase (beta-lactamase class C family)
VHGVDELERVVTEAAARFPGQSVVVAVTGASRTRVASAAGTDPNMLCEIGSVTKVMTATLVLRHVARGDVGLDDPVASYVTDFVLDPPDATARVTVGHLLCHASGVDFDEFTDAGDDDDCLARYVRDDLRGEVWDPPGTRWNYSNGGYSLLGRLVEVLDGRPFDDALVSRIGEPVGITVTTRPRLDPGRVVALVHYRDPATGEVVEEHRRFPRSAGPAGGALATASDLARFGYTLVSGGGELLPPAWATRMSTAQMAVRDGGQGLGWLLNQAGTPYYNGGTVGHSAYLTAIPGRAAIGAVANTPGGAVTVGRAVAAHLFGPPGPAPNTVPAGALDFAPATCVGRYVRRHSAHDISWDGDALVAQQLGFGPVADLLPTPPPFRLHPLGGGCYATEHGLRWDFSDPDPDGKPTRLLTLRSHVRST